MSASYRTEGLCGRSHVHLMFTGLNIEGFHLVLVLLHAMFLSMSSAFTDNTECLVIDIPSMSRASNLSVSLYSTAFCDVFSNVHSACLLHNCQQFMLSSQCTVG